MLIVQRVVPSKIFYENQETFFFRYTIIYHSFKNHRLISIQCKIILFFLNAKNYRFCDKIFFSPSILIHQMAFHTRKCSKCPKLHAFKTIYMPKKWFQSNWTYFVQCFQCFIVMLVDFNGWPSCYGIANISFFILQTYSWGFLRQFSPRYN